MKTEKESVFRVGDKVWHPVYGWGKVVENKYVELSVYFNDYQGGYGECYSDDTRKLLSFTEYELNANHVRPFEDGDILYGAKTSEYSVENISIYRDEETTYFHWNMTDDSIRHWAVPCATNSVLATEAQKQLLYDRLKRDGKRWNAETKQLEDLNEPKIGDVVIMWNAKNQKGSTTIDTLGKITKTSIGFKYYGWANVTDNAVKWDGTKEQFDRIRNGGNK